MRSPSSWMMIFPSILYTVYISLSLSLSLFLSITIHTIYIIIYIRVFNDSSRIPTNPRVAETLQLDISTTSKIYSNHHILKSPKKWFSWNPAEITTRMSGYSLGRLGRLGRLGQGSHSPFFPWTSPETRALRTSAPQSPSRFGCVTEVADFRPQMAPFGEKKCGKLTDPFRNFRILISHWPVAVGCGVTIHPKQQIRKWAGIIFSPPKMVPHMQASGDDLWLVFPH